MEAAVHREADTRHEASRVAAEESHDPPDVRDGVDHLLHRALRLRGWGPAGKNAFEVTVA